MNNVLSGLRKGTYQFIGAVQRVDPMGQNKRIIRGDDSNSVDPFRFQLRNSGQNPRDMLLRTSWSVGTRHCDQKDGFAGKNFTCCDLDWAWTWYTLITNNYFTRQKCEVRQAISNCLSIKSWNLLIHLLDRWKTPILLTNRLMQVSSEQAENLEAITETKSEIRNFARIMSTSHYRQFSRMWRFFFYKKKYMNIWTLS